jgi:hypothetical protein
LTDLFGVFAILAELIHGLKDVLMDKVTVAAYGAAFDLGVGFDLFPLGIFDTDKCSTHESEEELIPAIARMRGVDTERGEFVSGFS